MDIESFNQYLSAAATALGLFKNIRAELPEGPLADEAGLQIQAAEKALGESKAKMAQALGYRLCHCTFPPEPMLSVGYHQTHGHEEVFRCPRCEKQ